MGTALAVRWDVLDEDQARANHSQTLDRLVQRGGLDPTEALAVAQGRAGGTMDQGSQDQVLGKLAALVPRRR